MTLHTEFRLRKKISCHPAPPINRADEAGRMSACRMGLLPAKHIDTNGDATGSTVSDIAPGENRIHPFFHLT